MFTDGNIAGHNEKTKVSGRNVTLTNMKVDPCRQMNLNVGESLRTYTINHPLPLP